MRAGDGLAAVAYAPSRAGLKVKDVPVTASLETSYPFREELRFTVSAERPVEFPLYLRIPAWADGAVLQLDGAEPVFPQPGTFHELHREWGASTTLTLRLPMSAGLWHGYNGAVALERGPLVYSLVIGEDWRRVHEDAPYRELPHADWEVYPTTPWNYALDVGEETLADDVVFEEQPMGELPFSPQGAPMCARVRGRRFPEWDIENGSAADAPQSPVSSSEPLEELTLIPYGCTNLRVTEFPVLKR
jgi:hypothetical protein